MPLDSTIAMPSVSSAPDSDRPSRSMAYDPAVAVREYGMKEAHTLKTKQQQLTELLTLAPVSAAVGGVDTILQSVGLADEATVPKLLDGTAVGTYYMENREAAQLVGDLAFGFGIVGGAMKLARSGSMLEKAMQTAMGGKAPKWLFTSGKSVDDLLIPIAQRDAVVLTEQLGKSVLEDNVAKAAVRTAQMTRLKDNIKESMWANAAFYATQNSSLPDDMSATSMAAWAVLPDAAFAGIGQVTLKRAVRKMRDAFGEQFAAAQNPTGWAITQMPVSTPGMQDASFTMRANFAADTRELLKSKSDDPAFRQNAETALTTWEHELYNPKNGIVVGLGEYSPFPGVTSKFAMEPSHIATAKTTADNDPNVYMDAVSFEGFSEGFHTNFAGNREAALTKLAKKKDELEMQIVAQSSFVGPTNKDLWGELDKINSQMDGLKAAQTFVNEVDGTLNPTALRRFTVYDDNLVPIKRHPGKATDEGPRLSITFRDSDGQAKTIGMTNSGMLIMPEAPKIDMGVVIGGVNVSKAGISVAEAMQEAKYLLKDIGEDWHFTQGKRGQAVFDSLPDEIRTVLADWTGTSRGSKLRRWEEIGDLRFDQVVSAYRNAGLHARLAEVADADGTITLFRGESKAETRNPTNNVVSMSSNPKLAVQFGEHLTSRRVPVDDVVSVIGGAGDEWEFIVRNHKSRNFDQSVAPITREVFQPLGIDGHMATYKIVQKYMHDVFLPSKNTFTVYPGMHHTMLDMAADLIDGGNAARVKFAGKTPFKNFDDLQYASIMQKFDEIQQMWNVQKVGKQGLLKLTPKQQHSDIDIARMFNLPSNGNLTMNPLVQLMKEVYVPGQVIDMRTFFKSMDDIRTGIQVTAGVDPAAGAAFNTGFKFRGGLISTPLDRKPFVVAYKQEPPPLVTPEMVNERAAIYKQVQMDKMARAGQFEAGIVQTTLDTLNKYPEFWAVASRVDNLFEGQAASRGVINFKNAAVRDSSVAQALDQLTSQTYKAGNKYATEVVLKPVFPIFQKIQSMNHIADAQLYETARNATRQGWHVLEEPIQDPASKLWYLQLNPKEEVNKTLWKQHFGTDMPEGAFMPALISSDPTKKAQALGMTDLALQALQAEDYLSGHMLKNDNFLRYLKGKSPIKKKPWHTFPSDITGKSQVFLFDAKTMQLKHLVVGEDMNIAQRHADKVIKESLGTESPLVAKYSESVEEYLDMQAQIYGRPENYSISYLQTGRPAAGKTTSAIIETGPKVIQEMLEGVIRHADNTVRMTHSFVFDTELQFARHQKASAALKSDTRGLYDSNKAFKQTIWDQYESILLNKQGVVRETPLGKSYAAIENLYEMGLHLLADRLRPLAEPFSVAFNDKRNEIRYQALHEAVGKYNPFTSIADYGKRTHNLEIPMSMRSNMGTLNNLAINLSLRIADMGMPVVNMLGLVTVLPAVMKTVVRQSGESVEEWRRRVGPYASAVDGDVAIPNVGRILTTGIHDMYNDPQIRKAMEDARRRGLLDQEAAERAKLLTAPAKGYLSAMITKGVDILSLPTDKSEVFAREVSFASGYSLARKQMAMAHDDAIMFGHKVANMTVGDYRPSNRPQLFQGAAGAPLGLFTTYMWNWFSRVFGDLEDARWGSVIKQIGWQQAMFGAESLPGFETVSNVMFENYDGTVNLSDRLDQRFGTAFTDTFLMGSVSNVPKWFGASDGVAVTSRASIQFPLAQTDSIMALPAFKTGATLAEGTGRIVKSLWENGGFNSRQIAEIVSNHAVNGAVRNSIDWYMGYDVDQRGALINADLDSSIEGVARAFEFKTLREHKLAKEMSRSTRIQQIRADHIDSLNQKIMTAARDGKLTPEFFNETARDATRIGMTYPDFKRLLGATVQRGMIDKHSREMVEAFGSSHRQREAARYMTIMDDSQAGMD